jgi:hypothetical protein
LDPHFKEESMRISKSGSFMVVLGGAAALAFLGCDTDKDPQLRIISPTAGESVTMSADMKVPIVISANDFAIKTPTDCGTDTRCGVAYVNIDGDACNQPGKPYNNVLSEGRLGQDFVVEALFQYCAPTQRLGTHNLTVSLRKPDGSTVIGEGGEPAAATISLITKM